MSNRNMSLWGISDNELLAIVDDLADENGWTTTADVRLQLGENLEDTFSGVGPRLSWMRRYGWLEHGEKRTEWRLTAIGHAIVDNPELTKSVQNTLNKLNPAQRIRLSGDIAEHGYKGALEIRHALRREWARSLRGR